jgi:1,4-alpha-glucan branching enzyme
MSAHRGMFFFSRKFYFLRAIDVPQAITTSSMSTATLSSDQVYRVVENRHSNPFEVLGSHVVEQNNGSSGWVIRAYLPDAEAAWVIRPEDRQEYPMQVVHHPHFFECALPGTEDKNYLIKVKEQGHERVMRDPYAFSSPLLTDFDIYLFNEGNHHSIYEKMGAHPITVDGTAGVYFAVWAPNARNVSVVGNFNGWDGRKHQMRKIQGGVWDLFIPDLATGEIYKYEIKNSEGHPYLKSDPYGFQQQVRPETASVVADLHYDWQDDGWMERRRHNDPQEQPISVYELHIGSWLHDGMDNPPTQGYAVRVSQKPEARFLTYRELADKLIPYVKELGYTHIEVLPVAEHPFDGSWGYQVAGHFAPTSRFGTPQDFMYFRRSVPPKRHWGDCRLGARPLSQRQPRASLFRRQPSLRTFRFLARGNIRAGAPWSSTTPAMRCGTSWCPMPCSGSTSTTSTAFGWMRWPPCCIWTTTVRMASGCPTSSAAKIGSGDFLKQLNYLIFSYYPGALSIAEESTAWPNVSRPTYIGGLGFNFKWNMGWMHDMLHYFQQDPMVRRYHQNNITFSIWYAFSENFMLALSHDEVVHGKGNLLGKMPGDDWQKLANLRSLYGYMFTHPGKKTLFMGMEFGQISEWNCWLDLDWGLLNNEPFRQLKDFVADLNALYKSGTRPVYR